MKIKKLSLLMLAALLSALTANAQIHYVKETASGTGDGTSWENASDNLQAVITASTSGDTIFVAAGTYTPAENTAFVIGAKTLSIYGAFAGTETETTPPAVPDTTNNKTILQGNGNRVVDALTSNPTLTISGFCIQGGHTTAAGAGINIRNGAISYCTVVGNTSTNNAGGGIYSSGGTAVITNCLIVGNTSTGGGGVYAEGTNVAVDRCIIKGNTSTNQGGGIALNNTTITNSLVVGNHAANNGGGIRTNGNSNPVFVYNVTVANNTSAAANSGGGISSQNISHKITNSIIWGNTANSVTNDIQGGNDDSRNYCLYSGAVSTKGVGNIDSDPLFVDAANGNFRLSPGSPAINAGDATGVTWTLDLDGNPRIVGTIDIGAYEYDDTSTGTDAAIDMQNRIWSAGNALFVQSGKKEVLSIYAVSGALYSRQITTEGQTTINNLPAGLYIAKFDNRTYKIVIQ